MDKVNIVCFLWGNWGGKYKFDYVHNLYHGVKDNTNYPIRFICFTNYDKDNFYNEIEVKELESEELKGNLKKMIMYKKGVLKGQVFAFDLDMVIKGNIDNILSYSGKLCTLEGIHKQRKGKSAGSLISFKAEKNYFLWDNLINDSSKIEKATRGFERFYYDYVGLKMDFFQRLYPETIHSYKEEYSKISNSKIIWFHGKPKPHEVSDSKVKSGLKIQFN